MAGAAPSALSTCQAMREPAPAWSTTKWVLARSAYGATPDGTGRSLVAWSMLRLGTPNGSPGGGLMKARSV